MDCVIRQVTDHEVAHQFWLNRCSAPTGSPEPGHDRRRAWCDSTHCGTGGTSPVYCVMDTDDPISLGSAVRFDLNDLVLGDTATCVEEPDARLVSTRGRSDPL
jgi:hypothetical protein